MLTLVQFPISLLAICGLCCVKRTKKAAVIVKEAAEKRATLHTLQVNKKLAEKRKATVNTFHVNDANV